MTGFDRYLMCLFFVLTLVVLFALGWGTPGHHGCPYLKPVADHPGTLHCSEKP